MQILILRFNVCQAFTLSKMKILQGHSSGSGSLRSKLITFLPAVMLFGGAVRWVAHSDLFSALNLNSILPAVSEVAWEHAMTLHASLINLSLQVG